MKNNLGKLDRGVRISLGLFVILYGLLAEEWWEMLGFIALLTGIVGWSPLYALLGISTEETFHWTRIRSKSMKEESV